MSVPDARVFLDTNVLVYAFDSAEPAKQERAIGILKAAGKGAGFSLSTQVLQEFYVTVVRKLARPLPEVDAGKVVERLAKLRVIQVDTRMILAAIALGRKMVLSFWDALILVSALEGGCTRLLSEDLQNGMRLGRLEVVNPFLA
jgi:predicted nucleic acid-binding protein